MNKADWKIKKFGEVCEIKRGGSPRPISKYITTEPDGLNWIKIGDTEANSMYINRTAEKINKSGLSKTRFVKKGDFLLSNSMSFGRPYILNIDGCIHDGWLVISDNNSVFDKKFLFFLLSSPTVKHKFEQMAVGGVVNNLNIGMVSNLDIPIPPLPTQQKIVAELDTLNKIIGKKREQLAELDKLAEATFYTMFGDPVENEKGWVVKELEELCEITSSKRIYAKEYQEFGIPFYRSKEVIERSKNLKPSTELFISKDRYFELKDNFGVPIIGDILMTAVGTIGVVWVVDSHDPFYFKDGNLLWLKMNNKSNSVYFIYMLEKVVDEYKRVFSTGSAYSALTIVKLKKMKIIVPPIELQTQFAERIKQIEQQKALITHSVDEVQLLFDATMDRYFN